MIEITDEIIEKAKHSNTCPFCDGSIQPIEDVDDYHSKVYCIRCSRTWVEVYDNDGNLVDMEQNDD